MVLLLCDVSPHSREAKFLLGSATLLPSVVPVKRKAPYVVSPAMTGLMRGSGRIFPQGEIRLVCGDINATEKVLISGTE
jgi:hypothetical protein